MKHASIFRRGLSVIIALFVIAGLAMSQNFVLGGGTITNSGTIKVKGNITNSGVAGATTIGGTVQLKANGAQGVGTATNGAINFSTLVIPNSAGNTKTFNVNSTVSSSIDIAASAGASSQYDIGSNSLTLSGTIANTGTATAPYAFSSGSVTYNGGAQTVWGSSGFTYGSLTVDQAGAKTLNGDVTVSTAVAATNSANLTINGNTLTVNGSTYNVSGGTVTGSATSNIVLNGSGNLATFSVTGGLNNLTLNRTGDQVTLAADLSLAGALTLTAGTFSAGTQTLTLNGTGSVISGAGTFTSSSTGTVNYAQNAQNVYAANYGNLTFGTGLKTFPASTVGIAGSLTPGTATYSMTGNTVDFNGTSAQSIPAFTFNDLNITNAGGTVTATGAVTVGNNFDNGGGANAVATLDMDTYALSITGTKDNTSSTIKFAGASNGVFFNTGTINYSGTISQTIAQGSSYNNLTFSGSNSRVVASGQTVGTNSSLTVPSGVTLQLVDAGSTLNLHGTSDLTIASGATLDNSGTIEIGDGN